MAESNEEEVLLDEGHEVEEVFSFEDESQRNQYAQIRRKQASALGRENTAAKDLVKLIKKNSERGAANLTSGERNLMKGRWERTMEELNKFRDKKNIVVEEIQEMVHKTVTDNMSPEQSAAMDRFEAKLMEEIQINNSKHEAYILQFTSEVEPFLPVNRQVVMSAPQQVQVRGYKEFNPSPETHPGYLQKDLTPTEVSDWKRRCEAYLTDGKMSGKELPMETVKSIFDRLMDDHWKHRLAHKIEKVTSKEDIYVLIEKELEITFPIMKRRTTFFSMTQKPGVSFSDFYREVEKQGAESRLHDLTAEEMVGHVTLTRMSDKQLQKELITKVKSTKKEPLMEEALTQEAFRNLVDSNGKQQAKKVAPSRNTSHGSQRSRDNSRERGKECYSCGKKGHMARDCKNPKKWCTVCKNHSHYTDDCRSRNRHDDNEITVVETVNVSKVSSGQVNNDKKDRGRSKTPAARGRKSPERGRYRSPERGRDSGRSGGDQGNRRQETPRRALSSEGDEYNRDGGYSGSPHYSSRDQYSEERDRDRDRETERNTNRNGDSRENHHNKRIKTHHLARKVQISSRRVGGQDTPRIYGVGFRKRSDKRGFACQVLPDSGASMSLIPGWMAEKFKLEVNTSTAEDFSLFNASNEEMKIMGTATIWIIPDNHSKPRMIEGLVTPDMLDADILLSWVEMRKLALPKLPSCVY